jgi:hypothetical protein
LVVIETPVNNPPGLKKGQTERKGWPALRAMSAAKAAMGRTKKSPLAETGFITYSNENRRIKGQDALTQVIAIIDMLNTRYNES